jgi:hypothetical protein
VSTPGPDGLDDTCALVAQDRRPWHEAAADHVRVAVTGAVHGHQHLALAGLGHLDPLQRVWAGGVTHHHGERFHPVLLVLADAP